MKFKYRSLLLAATASALFAPLNSIANDSEAAFAFGGLKLVKNANISLEKEDLYISPDLIKVDYIFKNNSNKDIEAIISFPMPIVPEPVEEVFYENRVPDIDNLNFKTLIDGNEIKFEIHKIPRLGKRDVSAILKKHNLPVEWYNSGDFSQETISQKLFAQLNAKTLSQLEKDGIFKRLDKDLIPNWQVEYNIVRKQIFKAGSIVKVHHEYKPMIGGSVGGALEKSNRHYSIAEYSKHYCVDKNFLAAFDKKIEAYSKTENEIIATETWIAYILKSGANWAGPIKEFRLVIDKKNPDSIVSFCGNNVKKISPTQFEVKIKNFEPKNDLDVLIVNFHKIE